MLATLLAALILTFCPQPHPPPMVLDNTHLPDGSWWGHYPPVGNGWLRRPLHHGHDHHQKDNVPPTLWTHQSWRLSISELKALVSGKRGYYVRDWSVGLGWNNVSIPTLSHGALDNSCSQLRYIIEASLLHAILLDRVLVLPSFVYARSCEFSMYVYFLFERENCPDLIAEKYVLNTDSLSTGQRLWDGIRGMGPLLVPLLGKFQFRKVFFFLVMSHGRID